MNDSVETPARYDRAVRALAVFAVVAIAVFTLPGRASADPASDASVAADLVNETRWANGLAGLTPDRELQVTANRQAKAMAESNFIHHSDLGSQLSWGWSAWAENVGQGPSVGAVHGGFMNSPHHASNVLSDRYNYIGVGVAHGRDGTVYVAQVFGAW